MVIDNNVNWMRYAFQLQNAFGHTIIVYFQYFLYFFLVAYLKD